MLFMGNNHMFSSQSPGGGSLEVYSSVVKFSDIGVVVQLYSVTQTETVPVNER